jgi:hypothetical protein
MFEKWLSGTSQYALCLGDNSSRGKESRRIGKGAQDFIKRTDSVSRNERVDGRQKYRPATDIALPLL